MTCYICGQPATSVEHAPARSFFPKGYREHLVTVHSCADHNEATSADDEYVRNVIAMMIGNNDVALRHFLDVCVRSFQRSTGLLKTTTGVNTTVFVQEAGGNPMQSTYAFKVDRPRIDKVLRKIAYALFYAKFKARWNRQLNTGSEFLRLDSIEADDMGLLIQQAKQLLVLPPFEGSNPDVFKYVFLQAEGDINDQVLVMKFYDGFEAWIFPQVGSTGPVL